MLNVSMKVVGVDQFNQALKDAKKIPDQALQTIAAYTLQEIIEDTPEDTGLLKANWNPRGNSLSYARSKPIVRSSNLLSITFTNPTFYGSWVNYGHYTVNGGFVPGQFFVEKALARVESMSQGILNSSVQAGLDTYFHLRGGKWDSARVIQYQ